ncbi:gamma-glutamyltransferase [Roseomonas elaeocarpi]|uniref:Glutathione hydrolase proenzyme n=1 Tax=Roseomonas elaeocarpi TaxID=907779 RepID=A0ABV6JR58_9PROT
MDRDWRARAGAPFTTQKAPATASRGMVVSNHPLGSAAGAEMLAAGGNAVDAAIATFFTLSVVEPMMVGLLGGGLAHIRTPDGRHVIVDGLSAAPLGGSPTMYTPISDEPARRLLAEGRANEIGALAVASPAALRAWCDILARYGTLPLRDVMAPAIRHAEKGFTVTTYLADCIADAAGDLGRDPEMARVFLPGGTPLAAGARLVQGDTAETLRTIAAEGPDALYGGALGRLACDWFAQNGGVLAMADFTATHPVEREPIRASYRGHEVIGPPAPSAGGMHVAQMLNLLEGFALGASGSGTPATLHLIAEALKLAFADRAMVTADPAFLRIPVERLTSKAYAAERRAELDPARARDWAPGVAPLPYESNDTTHVTTADASGIVVTMTQTINGLFGARVRIPGLGLTPNNYMSNFDPHPGRALSVAPGKRVTTSMMPTIVLRDGAPWFALGLPGGLKIFGSAMQAVINMIDHGMTLQEAVEAPRIWTQGLALEVEGGVPAEVREALEAMGHRVATVPTVGGGMNAVSFEGSTLTGAACWRADGTPMGMAGGLARPGVRFVLEQARR